MYNMTIDAVPLTKLLGSTVYISPLLRFHFWECVYYNQSETSFPSDSKEGLGNIVGISEHCGDVLLYKVLTANTGGTHSRYWTHYLPLSLMTRYHWRRQLACQHVCRGARHP
jgi:hypothetical protein